MTNGENHLPYAACAVVVMVYTKFPFYQAYALSEELCSSAKKFGAGLDENGRVSAIDWHIEFGQLKDSLSVQREDDKTEDVRWLELRPVTGIILDGIEWTEEAEFRSYDFFCTMCQTMKNEYGKIARCEFLEGVGTCPNE